MGTRHGGTDWRSVVLGGFLTGLIGSLLVSGTARAMPAAPVHYSVAARTPVTMTLTGLLTVEGQPAQAGVEIAAYDAQGIRCGASGVDAANGGAFILHIYGDDSTTPGDEGASPGEGLTFEVYDGAATVGQASLEFQEARAQGVPFGNTPPSYPPVFEDRASYSMNVSAANRPPVAVADAITVDEAGTATALASGAASVLANDTDAEGNPLTAVLDTGPTRGTLTLNPDGTFSYQHDGSETTSDSFTYHARDGTLDSSPVTVSIAVAPANDPPVAVADSIAVGEGGTATALVSGAGSVLANDTDAEGNPLTAVLDTGPTHGTLTLNPDGTFSYRHDGSETTSDTFTYHAHDGTSASSPVLVSIVVTPANDPPVAAADVATTLRAASTEIDVLANDSDAEGAIDPTTVVIVSPPANGTTSTSTTTGIITYTPAPDFLGQDTFTYQVRDAEGTASNPATVTVNVAADVVTVSVEVQAGWNLISHPVATCFHLQGTSPPTVALPQGIQCVEVGSIEEAFPGIAGKYELIRSFDADGVHNYDPTVPPHLNDLAYVAGGYGYWIKMSQASVLTFTGERLAPASSMSLPAGWTLVGHWGRDVRYVGTQPSVSFPPGVTFTRVNSISDVFSSLGSPPEMVKGFDANGEHSFQPGAGGDLTYVGPGYGYWIKLSAPGSLDYDLP